MRIVSLLPSATDIVVALGGANNLVGVSHSCSGDFEDLPKLTSTWIDVNATSASIDSQVRHANRPLYELDIEKLARLAPDVVISQSLCDVCAVPSGDVVQAISQLPGKPALVDLTPSRLAQVSVCFEQVGKAINLEPNAAKLIQQWHDVFAQFKGQFVDSGLKVAFLDWLDPPFVAGHWMPDMLDWLGVTCVLGQKGEPSFEVSWPQLTQENPDLVVAACCGFDITRTMNDANNFGMPIVCLDGYQHFNRPSPALMPSIGVFADVIESHLLNE